MAHLLRGAGISSTLQYDCRLTRRAVLPTGDYLRSDHLMLLIAGAHPLHEVIKSTTFPLGLLYDKLLRGHVDDIELKPFTPRCELSGQASLASDQTEMGG